MRPLNIMLGPQWRLQKNFVAMALSFIATWFLSHLSQAQESPEILWKRSINSDRINAVTFSWDGELLISGGSDRLINIWRVSDGTMLKVLNSNAPAVHESAIESLSITRDGTRLASASHRL